jgi:hypothetical protein
MSDTIFNIDAITSMSPQRKHIVILASNVRYQTRDITIVSDV